MLYSYEIVQTDSNGLKETTKVSTTKSPEQAQIKCIGFAIASGWTYPKWWQFWRWGDTQPKLYKQWLKENSQEAST